MKQLIFLVDDSDSNQALAEEILESNFKIVTASSADEMFSLLERMIPHLIFLDIEMPGMDGFEAMKKLQADRRFAGIPVIFLTAHSCAEIESKCFEMGAVDFISKPFTAKGLITRARTNINMKILISERKEYRKFTPY